MLRQYFGKIRNRMVLISILPLLTITLILTSFMVSTRSVDLTNSLAELGNTTTDYIASTAEFGIFTGDLDYLARLAEGALNSQSVSGVTFIDQHSNILTTVGNPSFLGTDDLNRCLQTSTLRSEPLWYFCKPVLTSTEDIDDYDEALASDEPTISGWVVVAVSQYQLQAQQKQNIIISSFVSLVVMGLSILFALRISQSISEPVQHLAQSVKDLDRASTEIRASDFGPDELQYLAQSINRMAAEVKESQASLEDRIENATSQLTSTMVNLSEQNHELEKTRDDLQAAMTSKDHFLARMSHELRTPLTTVIGYSRLLNNTSLSNEQGEYSHNITQASSLLLSTIDDILDFSKLQSNALTIESICFDLRECIEDLISMHAYNAYSKSLELVLLIDSDVPSQLVGDPMRIKQIVNNLLGNAIKFTNQGEVVLHISLVEELDDNLLVEFHIRDSGIGIDDHKLSTLFHPFTQADNSITRRFGGSGLGLVICKQLIELMKGSIDIESTPDKGTNVHFQLPLKIYEDDRQYTIDQRPYHKLRVLIYDNNPWSRRALRNQFSQWTGNVFAARTFEQMDYLLKQPHLPFDLVLLGLSSGDVEQAYLSELLSTLRIDYSGPVILLACTGNIQSKIPEDILATFAPIYGLSKPLRHTAVRSTLGVLIGENDSPHSTTIPETTIEKSLDGLTILVAEDNGYNRQLITSLLELFGAIVIQACNGREAVEHFRNHNCDAVLMDVHMPEMNGIEATSAIVGLSADKSIPVIGLTANVIENEEKALLEAGAVEILYKPLDEKKLIFTLCLYTQREQQLSDSGAMSILGNNGDSLRALGDELTRLIKELRTVLKPFDATIARERLHEIMGLSGLFGMDDLRQHVQELQHAVQEHHYSDFEQLVAVVETDIITLADKY